MEVLVALVLLTIFTVVAYRALNAVLDARQRAQEELEHWRGLATVFAQIEADLSNALPPTDPRNGREATFVARTLEDGSSQFELLRMLPEDAEDGTQRVGYRCTQGRLLQRVWPQVANLANAARETELLAGLKSCTFRYMDGQGQWLPAWLTQVAQPLPLAVEFQLVEGNGTPLRRVWKLQ